MSGGAGGGGGRESSAGGGVKPRASARRLGRVVRHQPGLERRAESDRVAAATLARAVARAARVPAVRCRWCCGSRSRRRRRWRGRRRRRALGEADPRVGGRSPREEPRGDHVRAVPVHAPPALPRLDGHGGSGIAVAAQHVAVWVLIAALRGRDDRRAIRSEEAFLRQRFGGDYDAYAAGAAEGRRRARFSVERALRNREWRALGGLVRRVRVAGGEVLSWLVTVQVTDGHSPWRPRVALDLPSRGHV